VEKPPEESVNSVRRALYRLFIERGDPEAMAFDVLVEELAGEAGVDEGEALAALALIAAEGAIEFTPRNLTREGASLVREAAIALAKAYISGGGDREAEAALLLAAATGDPEAVVEEALRLAICAKLERLSQPVTPILRRALEYELEAAAARARRLSPAVADKLEGLGLDGAREKLCGGGG